MLSANCPYCGMVLRLGEDTFTCPQYSREQRPCQTPPLRVELLAGQVKLIAGVLR